MTTASRRSQWPGSLGKQRVSRRDPGAITPGSPDQDARVAWAGFCAIAAPALVFLLWEGRGDTFFYDEWSWIQVLRSGLHSILGSYNQHLEVAPPSVLISCCFTRSASRATGRTGCSRRSPISRWPRRYSHSRSGESGT